MGVRLKLAAVMWSVAFSSIMAAMPAAAQSSQRSAAPASAQPTVLGPAMLRPGTADLSCGTEPAGLGPWGADRIERTLSLDSTQLNKFNDLKIASQRAIQYLNESCPKNEPVTPTGRLEALERRLSAMLEAVRTVQPALDDFYAALTDEQKARLNAIKLSDDPVVRPPDPAIKQSNDSAIKQFDNSGIKQPNDSGAKPSNDIAGEPTFRGRRSRVRQRRGEGQRFRFRLPLPFPF